MRRSEVPSLSAMQNLGSFDTPQRQTSQHARSKTEGGGGMADDWLREVDQLAWSQGGSQQQAAPTQTYYPPGSMTNRQAQRQLSSYRQPGIPRRSSRRTPSQEQNPFSFGSATSNHPRFQSQSPDREDSTDFIDFDSSGGGERERNAMNPSHRRAADSIHRNSFGASAAMRGMSADIMAGSPPQQGAFGGVEERFQGQGPGQAR